MADDRDIPLPEKRATTPADKKRVDTQAIRLLLTRRGMRGGSR